MRAAKAMSVRSRGLERNVTDEEATKHRDVKVSVLTVKLRFWVSGLRFPNDTGNSKGALFW